MLTMLGIPNCDTVKKARKYLEENVIPYRFRDIRKEPLSSGEWSALVEQDERDALLNTRSPSFRKTGVAADALTPALKVSILEKVPTAMKRPVMLEKNRLCSIGFSETIFATYNRGETGS